MTFYETLKSLSGADKERYILKNLFLTKGMNIRKNRFNWTAYNSYSKYFFEFYMPHVA